MMLLVHSCIDVALMPLTEMCERMHTSPCASNSQGLRVGLPVANSRATAVPWCAALHLELCATWHSASQPARSAASQERAAHRHIERGVGGWVTGCDDWKDLLALQHRQLDIPHHVGHWPASVHPTDLNGVLCAPRPVHVELEERSDNCGTAGQRVVHANTRHKYGKVDAAQEAHDIAVDAPPLAPVLQHTMTLLTMSDGQRYVRFLLAGAAEKVQNVRYYDARDHISAKPASTTSSLRNCKS